MEIWNGDCCVHDKIDTQMVLDKLEEYPDADSAVHPESSCSHDDRVLNHPRAFMYSTAGLQTCQGIPETTIYLHGIGNHP